MREVKLIGLWCYNSWSNIAIYTHIAQLERALAFARIIGSNPIVRSVNIKVLSGLSVLYYYFYAFIRSVLLYCFLYIDITTIANG